MLNKQKAFTLLEVLIAMMVLGVGLLGLAGLQASSLRNNQSAYNRSQATQIAYDVIDRIRVNADSVANYDSGFMAVTAATEDKECLTKKNGGCNHANMAKNDLFELQETLKTALPAGTAVISTDAPPYKITINWDDNRDGTINNDDPKFEVSFEL